MHIIKTVASTLATCVFVILLNWVYSIELPEKVQKLRTHVAFIVQ